MSVTCSSAEDLSKAMKNNEDEIIVTGDFKNHVLRIKATGKGIWAACFIALTVAVTSYLTMPETTIATGGPGGAVNFVAGTAAAGVAATTLGTAVVPAIAIAVAAGGVGILNTLRDKYKIVEKDDKQIKLKRR